MSRKIYAVLGIVVAFILILTLLYGLFFASNPKSIPSALIGKKAKPFTVTTFDGEEISLAQYLGSPIVLNFWASWCFACRQEAKILEAVHQYYTPKGAVLIGIAINDKREDSLSFIRKYRKTYILAPDDKSGTVSLDYGVTAVPETFLIDKEGNITDKILGAVTKEKLVNFLEQQLN